ncbi:MAG: hypothetical protein F6K24_34365, partial [Okeania sp. SIO2D1]|nr:hypothetical protein [Okeania sp. SIO2D1]
PGAIVLMDNLSVHKGSRIQELISSTGAKLIFLPGYSPDLSPIELCWSKFKEFLRSRQALSSRAIRSSDRRSVGGASAAATSLKLLKMMS